MPRLRPHKVFEVGPLAAPTVWYGPRVTGDAPDRAARVRVVRPAGGGRKARVLFDGRVVMGRRLVRPDAVRIELAPGHRLYVTIEPLLRGVDVELLRFSDEAAATPDRVESAS